MDTWNLPASPQNHPHQVELLPLSQYRILQVHGADAAKFLQGQCTCNVEQASTTRWLLGAHCNPKGRMHASFTLQQDAPDKIYLRLHQSILDHALAALGKYAVFSKVTLAPADNTRVLALSGEPHPLRQLVHTLTGREEPLQAGEVLAFAGGKALVRQQDLVEVWVPQEELEGLLSRLGTQVYCHSPEAGEQRWRLRMIARGEAEVTSASIEKLLPQELNFQYIDGISFNKGCYTGQEVIARLNYRATLKKHLYRAALQGIDASQNLAFGDVLLNSEGKKIGSIVSAARDEAGDYALLVLANDDARQHEKIALNLASQAVLEWQPLPYAIT